MKHKYYLYSILLLANVMTLASGADVPQAEGLRIQVARDNMHYIAGTYCDPTGLDLQTGVLVFRPNDLPSASRKKIDKSGDVQLRIYPVVEPDGRMNGKKSHYMSKKNEIIYYDAKTDRFVPMGMLDEKASIQDKSKKLKKLLNDLIDGVEKLPQPAK